MTGKKYCMSLAQLRQLADRCMTILACVLCLLWSISCCVIYILYFSESLSLFDKCSILKLNVFKSEL